MLGKWIGIFVRLHLFILAIFILLTSKANHPGHSHNRLHGVDPSSNVDIIIQGLNEQAISRSHPSRGIILSQLRRTCARGDPSEFGEIICVKIVLS